MIETGKNQQEQEPQKVEPEKLPEEVLPSGKPTRRERAPISDERKEELKKVFTELVITKGEGKNKKSVDFTPEEVERIIGNEPIQHYPPETLYSILSERFLKNVDNLNISLLDWKKAVIDQAQLFIQSPETINNNIEGSSQMLGLKKEQFIKAALDHAQLFFQSPETINNNIEGSSQMLGLTKEQFVKAALKRSSLFAQSPETINKNIEGSSQMLGLKKEQFIKAALRVPPLFSQSPETTNKKVEGSSKILRFKKEQFIEAALKQPSLFTYSPETIGNNFKTLQKLFSISNVDISKNPAILTYAPERTIVFYIIGKIANKNYLIYATSENPLKFAKQKLSGEDYKKFELSYNYLDKLSRKMRKRNEKNEEVKDKSKFYNKMISFTEKFFGKPNESLTREKISVFEEYIKKHLEK
jgi:hypothetical protein